MNTAVFSVVYPGIDDFFAEFLSSLSKQTQKNFTLFLINDGLANIEEFLRRTNFNVNVKNAGIGSPVALRKMGIQWVVGSGAEVIIFADADDYFAENRVEISMNILDKCTLVFNELILTGQKLADSKPMIGAHFSDGDVIDCADIKSANCLGLSNTAIRVKNIPKSFEQIPDDVVAFDWTFFSMCLHAGAKGIFTNKTATYYRQHENNLASPCGFNNRQILLGVRVKRDHYKILSNFYKEYLPLADVFRDMFVKLESDETLRKEYCHAVQKNAPAMPLWWESIKTLEELGL